MYDILVGKQRSLVFPVMCNAHITIPYADNVADTNNNADNTDDVGYGIWSHEGRFTFEAIVTPYDINGYGTQSNASKPSIANSKKIMPALSASEYTVKTQYASDLYLARDDRIDHEMRLFHSDNFKISLINDTKHNENEPANYKIKVSLTLGTTTETFTSSYAISPATSKRFKWSDSDDNNGFNARGLVEYKKVATTASGSTTTVIRCSPTTNFFGGDKQEVYIRDGFNFTSLGTITSKTTTAPLSITLTSAHSEALPTGTDLYLPVEKDPIYVNDFFHIACSVTDTNEIKVFVNNREILLANHSVTNTNFTFGNNNMYVGANGSANTGANSAKTNNQFMGEIHEMSIINLNRNTFPSINNLHPNFNNCLLYLRFEEVDV